jgi:hypothetical protein
MDDGRADAAVLVVVQVAPADSDCRHVDEGLVRPAFAQIEWGGPARSQEVQDPASAEAAAALPKPIRRRWRWRRNLARYPVNGRRRSLRDAPAELE